MSRSDVLVDADWAEAHIGDPGVVIVEVDEDTSAYDKGHIPARDQDRLEEGPAGPGPPRLRGQDGLRGAAVRAGHLERRHGPALRRQQQLVRRLRLLVLPAVRARQGPAARRRPQEVGAGLARAEHRRARAARGPATPRRSRTPRCARCATRCSTRSASATWSTSAPRTSSRAGCSPRRTCRRSRRSGPGTFPPRATCPGPRRPTRTARSAPTTSSAQLYQGEAGLDFGKDTIAYCRIGERSAHTWFVLHELLGLPNVKNYDGSWTEYGSLVGVPIELGDAR